LINKIVVNKRTSNIAMIKAKVKRLKRKV